MKKHVAVDTWYCYDGDQVIAEYVGTTLVRKFIYGPGIDEPIIMIAVSGETETPYYYHFDGLGSVIALSDSNGDLVEIYSYDVFGDPNRISSVSNPHLFTGRRYDSETDLYFYRARYYNPAIGRFMQTDPIDYEDGLNVYTYVQNNPVRWADPYGLLTGVEEAAGVCTITGWSGWGFGGYMTAGGTFVSCTGVGAAAVGTAAAAGTTGYGIGKYAVCPALDWVGDRLYDPIVNRGRGKFYPTRKRAKDAARRHGARTPIHDGPHGPGELPHFHGVDGDGNKIRGRQNIHFEHPEVFYPWLLWPYDVWDE